LYSVWHDLRWLDWRKELIMRRTKRVLTDEQWERIAPLLPQHSPSPKGGRPWANDRECLEGILWLLRAGARWRDIPIDLPSGSTCWRRLRDWAGEGVLEELHAILIEELDDLGALDFDELLADATFIRAKKGAPRSGKPRPARV
jgi:transposase